MGRYIDTEEFKHKINNSKWYGADVWEEILDMLNDCDSVSPSQTKGEWRKSKTHASLWVCSVCDWGLIDCYDFNFCPECGADMRADA